MNLHGLGKIEKPDFFIEVAFAKANKRAGAVRTQIKSKKLNSKLILS